MASLATKSYAIESLATFHAAIRWPSEHGSFALPSNALEVLCETCIFSKRRRTRPLKNLKAPKNTLRVLETEATRSISTTVEPRTRRCGWE